MCVCVYTHARRIHICKYRWKYKYKHTYTHTHTHTHSQATHQVQRIKGQRKNKNLAPVRYTTTTLTLTSKVEGCDGGVELERRRQCLGSLGADGIACKDSEERAEASVLPDEFFRASPSSTPTIHRPHTHTYIWRRIKPRGVCALEGGGCMYIRCCKEKKNCYTFGVCTYAYYYIHVRSNYKALLRLYSCELYAIMKHACRRCIYTYIYQNIHTYSISGLGFRVWAPFRLV